MLFVFKNHSGTLSECSTVWNQIRTNVLSVMIWVQTVFKDSHQMTKVAARKEGVKKKLVLMDLFDLILYVS